jgi:hypothetical protein
MLVVPLIAVVLRQYVAQALQIKPSKGSSLFLLFIVSLSSNVLSLPNLNTKTIKVVHELPTITALKPLEVNQATHHEKEKSNLDDLTIVVTVLFGVSVGLASVFYSLWHKWQFSTSLFYATQAITGCMYGVPEEKDPVSQGITMVLYILGSSIVTGALSVYLTSVIDGAIKKSRKRGLYTAPLQASKTDTVSIVDSLGKSIDWEDNRATVYIFSATLLWIVVGVFYGVLFEKYDFAEALYSSVAAISASGTHPPPCLMPDTATGSDSCQLGSIRGYFMSLYLLVGIPLFSLTLGQFSGLAVDRAVRSNEYQKMKQGLSDEEFDFACSFHAKDRRGNKNKKISFTEFVLTELYRLKRVDSDELMEMREVFNGFDLDGDGFFDKNDLVGKVIKKSKTASTAI